MVEGLREGISQEVAKVITRVLQDERMAKALANSILCKEHSRPLEPSADLHPNLYEIRSQLLEVLNNVMSKVGCGRKLNKLKYT